MRRSRLLIALDVEVRHDFPRSQLPCRECYAAGATVDDAGNREIGVDSPAGVNRSCPRAGSCRDVGGAHDHGGQWQRSVLYS